jgi:hypothetical protein
MAQSPINASKIPVPDLDAALLSVDAGFLSTDAGDVRSAGADVKSSWAGLSGVYSAPEDAQLFAVMDHVATVTDSFATDVQTVARALQDFATEAGPLAATLASTKSSAAAFAKKVSGDDKWDHDGDLVKQNNDYVHTVNTTVVAFQAAERKAANTIEKLIGGHTWHAADPNATTQDKYAYGYDSIPDNAKTPWGADVQKKDGCLKSTVKGVGHFFVGIGAGAWGLVKGVGLLAWDATGLGGWDKFKQAWEGIAFLGTLVMGPVGWAEGAAMFGPKGYLDRLTAMGKGFIDYDEWKTDPGKAAGETVFNVLTVAIPGADVVGGIADGAKGAELAADASRAADAAEDASTAGKVLNAAKAGAKAFTKYTDPFTYVGKLPKVLDIANGLKTKFTDLTGLGKTTDLNKTMDGWTHEPHTNDHPNTGTSGDHNTTDHGGTDHGGTDHGGTDSHDATDHNGTGDHGGSPSIPKGLKHQDFETAHGYGSGDVHTMKPGDHPVDFGTKKPGDLGRYGEELTRQDLENRGYTLVAERVQIKIPGSGKYFIPDFVARSPDGQVVLVESKMGAGAHFTPNQLEGYGAYAHSDAPLQARSARVNQYLSDVGARGPVSGVEVYRWNTEITPTQRLLDQTGISTR